MTARALDPLQLAGLELENRFVKTATYEGLSPEGRVSDGLIAHHSEQARHGVALTTVAYAAVHPSGRTFADQLLVTPDAGLDRLATAVHAAGGRVSIQLSHCGGFSKHRAGGRPMGPSFALNAYGLAYGLPFVRPMTPDDMAETAAAYAEAAAIAVDAGVDALELHCGHGYLLSQFLSPAINRRRDDYGGSLANRLRFPLEVVHAIRARVGEAVPLLAKINLHDGIRGATGDEAVPIARALVEAGVNAIVPSGGLVQRSAFYLLRGDVPLSDMVRAESSWLQRISMRILGPLLVRRFPYSSSFFREQARALVDAVDAPVGLLGGVDSAAAVRDALAQGFSFVVMGRALLADPDFIERMAAGEDVVSRCTHCNQCVARMDQGVACVLDLSQT